MDTKSYLVQMSHYARWSLFALIVSLSVSLNQSTEILTRFGTIGKIELNFDTGGHVPYVTWTMPQARSFQHDFQVYNLVKTTKDYKSTVAEDGMFAALEIYNVNFLDAGTYTCRMDFSDKGISSERSIQVSVIAFPSVSMRNDATENETISATCCVNVSLTVEDSIMWNLNQSGSLLILKEVKTNSAEDVIKNMCSEINFEVHRSYHRQLLRCSLKEITVYTEVAMDVQYPASIRYAENGLRHLSVHQFANVCCISDGNPRPSVELQWLSREGEWKFLSNVAEYIYHIEPFIYWTFMIHVAVGQPLQVRCFATNEIPPAVTTKVLNLAAKYPVSARMLSPSTTVPEGSDIIIECQSDGYPPPDTMLVMLSNMNGTEWAHLPIKAKWSNKSTATFELRSLAMIDTGEYQCLANNSEGYASSKTIEINDRNDVSCVLSSERKRFEKDESNSDNAKNESQRQTGVYDHNYPADIQLYATTSPRYDNSSCEDDEEWEDEPGPYVDYVDDYTPMKQYHVQNLD
ncbi:neural cell adhesion molecule 1-A-like isoform X2 [Apostichopus japonicus]|uniref:neural cell adhesion molecule 1-A-like isoform X2 n=1 Tax=Stichopus japonicus TaxID=307972 RepID=UPI003AB77170